MKTISLTQLLRGAFVSALLFASIPATAQTFFGSGGTTNTATNATNVGLGYGALKSVNSGFVYNTAIGYKALYSFSGGAFPKTGNTAIGYQSLYSNTTSVANTAIGSSSLYANQGASNTAIGYQSLYSNTLGAINTAIGTQALYSNIRGSANTAIGYRSLYSNTEDGNGANGAWNTAIGYQCLYSNTIGTHNAGIGYLALYSNTTGKFNTANGVWSLYSNTKGYSNTANGASTLYWNTTGSGNTANGSGALGSNTSGNSNIAIGSGAGSLLTTGSNNIDIGNGGVAAESGAIRIGTTGTQTSTYIAGINGATASSGVAVYIDANGQLGTVTSSRRFKNDIKTMGNVSDRLLQLRPVTFRYKTTDAKGAHPLQYGLIAEEVAKVFPELVQYDKIGKPFTIYYHLLTPMLLSGLQREHASHKAEVATQQVEITALKTALQKQSAELASMKQAQAEQRKLLAQLAAYVQSGKTKAPTLKADFVQH